MGYRPLDVLLEKSMIEGDGLRERFDSTVSSVAETAAPGLASHGSHPRVARDLCISLWHRVTQSRHALRVLSIQRRTGKLGESWFEMS